MSEAVGADVPGGPELLRAHGLPARFAHGFATRRGGISPPPYDTLNAGLGWGDAPAAVAENRARILRAAGAARLALCTQVHGAEVRAVEPGEDLGALAAERADALVGAAPGLALGVLTADCVPILLADARTGACAAVHAGWRGTVAGVALAAVRGMGERFGARPEDLCIAIGPSIGPCCFEVGDDVVEALAARWPTLVPRVVVRGEPRPRVDLWRANAGILAAAGVPPARIELLEVCTACDPVRCFSYRRDRRATGAGTGQHLSLIAPRW